MFLLDSDPTTSSPERSAFPLKSYADDSARVAFTEKLLDKIGHLPGCRLRRRRHKRAFQWKEWQKFRHDSRTRGPTRRITPRSLRIWGWRRLFQGHGFLSARRPIPYCRRFAKQSSSLRRGPGLCSLLLAERRARSAIVFSKAATQGKDADAFTIVGVVGSVKQAGLTEEAAQGAVYYPYGFHSDDIFAAVRTACRRNRLD